LRVFFALLPSPDAIVAIEAWRKLNWPMMQKVVPAANFHITIQFVGEIESSRLESLHSVGDKLVASEFTVCFDQLGFWANPGIFWLGCSEVPELLSKLQEDTVNFAGEAGFRAKSRDFVPHLTLARRVQDLPPAPVVAADFKLSFSEIHLLESVAGANGVHYQSLLSWPLTPIPI